MALPWFTSQRSIDGKPFNPSPNLFCSVFDQAICKRLDHSLIVMGLYCLLKPSQSGQNVDPSSSKKWCTNPCHRMGYSNYRQYCIWLTHWFWPESRTRSDYALLRIWFGTIRNWWFFGEVSGQMQGLKGGLRGISLVACTFIHAPNGRKWRERCCTA